MDHAPATPETPPAMSPDTLAAPVADPAAPDVPRSRRAILAGALGGVAALVAGRLGNPDRASAAAGSPLIIGSQANNAGSADTQLVANSSVISLKVYQQGPGTALMGYVTRTTGDGRGVYGRTDSPSGDGVQARSGATVPGSGAAIRAIGGKNPGIVVTGDDTAIDAQGGTGSGLRATSANGAGVYATGGSWGVIGTTYGGAYVGVLGESTALYGVYGTSGSSHALVGTTSSGRGVSASSSTGTGVYATCTMGSGVHGLSNALFGVWGESLGIEGQPGVLGTSTWGAGVYAASTNNVALYVEGSAIVSGNLSKGGGSFKIDHPLDPANKYLLHSFVESPDMMNVYNGNVTLDDAGEATVELPDWWDALNRDARYQLTPFGASMPDLYVRSGVRNRAFKIAGGVAGKEVSWQVTGIRKDAWAEANRIPVEVAKTGQARGKYLHPKAHGKPESAGIDHAMQARLKRERAAAAKVDAADRARAPMPGR
jgi:hypothetical protein